MLTETTSRSKPLSKLHRRSRRTQGPLTASKPAPAFDRDYWLRHCEGFRVEAADGAIGFVDEVDVDSSPCVQLHVRAGLLGKRVLVVPAGNVAFIVPRAKKLWLASPVQIVESGLACS